MALGLCTEIGSSTSHRPFCPRSLDIPAVVGVGQIEISSGAQVIIDGSTGQLLIDPDEKTLSEYQAQQKVHQQARALEIAQAQEPALTADGYEVEIVANIGSVADAQQAIQMGAKGVGLRTEFLFLQGDTLPLEEEQYRIYRAIADVFQQLP